MEQFHMMVQQFLEEHETEFDSPNEAIDFFTKMYNKGDFGGLETKESKSMNKVEEAQATNSPMRRKKLLEEAIKIWPENWDAQAILIDTSYRISFIELIEQYKSLEKRAHEAWYKHTEKGGYHYVEERPYLRLKDKLAYLYMKAGMLEHALEHFLELYRIDESDALGSRYNILTLYVRKFDWKKAWRFFKSVESRDKDDRLLFLIIILAVLTDRTDLAKGLLKKLVIVNSQIEAIFSDDMWPVEDLYDAELLLADYYRPFSYQSLLMTLSGILPLVSENEYLFEWLKRETMKLIPESKKTIAQKKAMYGELDPHEEKKLSDFIYALREDESNPLRGMRIDRARILYHAGLRTYKDFTKKTEKQILALQGIGPNTIKELKTNGVQFKK